MFVLFVFLCFMIDLINFKLLIKAIKVFLNFINILFSNFIKFLLIYIIYKIVNLLICNYYFFDSFKIFYICLINNFPFLQTKSILFYLNSICIFINLSSLKNSFVFITIASSYYIKSTKNISPY